MTKTNASELRITLLGTPRIRRGGELVALPRRRTRSLLFFLSASPGSHTREELVDLLWPNLTPAKGRRQLSDALSDLRRVLGGNIVQSDAEQVALSAPACDASEFTAAVDRAGGLTGEDAEETLSNALELYGGELLAGVRIDGSETFEEWVREQRLSLSVIALGAYAKLATLRLDAADLPGAIRVAQHGLELDNLREDLWRIVVQARADMDDRQGALAEYKRCKETLQRELGIAPDADTEALRRRISAERGSPAAGTTESAAAKARPPLPATFRLPGNSLALVGREHELASLLRAWYSACQDPGGLAVIEGEPGIGKTRLVAEFGARAAAAGAVVLAARCPDLRDPPPYGPIEEAIRGVLPSMPSGAFKELGPAWLPWVGRLLPELGLGVEPPEPMAPEEEKTKLAEGTGQLLDVISGGGPLLLIVEDVHWAHAATVQLMHALARRNRPLLVLATMRDTEPRTEGTQATARASADLAKEGLATTVSLGALGATDTETLVKLAIEAGAGNSTPNAAALAKLAEGQPLFALELTRAVLESPNNPDLPESLANAIGSRINHASEFAQQILSLTAVFGRPVTLPLLGRAVGVESSADTLVDAGDELIARRLLQEDESGALTLSHGLIQDAIYKSLSVSRRRALHARAAGALESGGEVAAGVRSEVLARHYRLAGDLSHAAEHLMAAGERADTLGEVDTAAARFRAASELLRKEGKDREAALALERSGKCVWRTCEIPIAAAAFTDALEIWPRLPDNKAPLSRLHAEMAQLLTRWGYAVSDPDQVVFHVDAAIRLTNGTGGEERSLALSARSFLRTYTDDLEGGEQDAQQALGLANDSDAAWQSAMDAISANANFRQNWQGGVDATLQRIMRATDRNDPFELYDASFTATTAFQMLGDMAAAEEQARTCERAGAATGQSIKVLHGQTLLAEIFVSEGRLEEANALLPGLMDHPEHLSDRPSLTNMRKCLAAELAAGRGDIASARSLIRRVPQMTHYRFVWYGRVAAAYERAQAAIREASTRKKAGVTGSVGR